MSAFSYLYFVCFTVLCLLSTDLSVKAWPQGPQDAMEMAQAKVSMAKETFAAQIPGKIPDQDKENDSMGRHRRAALMERLKRQTDDSDDFYDENSIIIPDLEYTQSKDFGQYLREGIDRLAESIKRTGTSVARSMEQFVNNMRQSFNGNESSYNETRELSKDLYYSDQM